MSQQNRFVAKRAAALHAAGRSASLSRQASWVRPFSAEQRALVVLIENGGIDLELGALVDLIADKLPVGSGMVKAALRPLAGVLRDKIRAATDTLLESAELALNRYGAAKPDQYGSVTVLRDGTATYAELKAKLIELSRAGKIIDVIILTHGGTDTISLASNIDGQMLRAMRTEYGKPLQIRSVYMMNCKGSSLNQAWLDAGAKTVCGTAQNNYLPEPTTFFFWRNWRAGQSFQTAATNAYQATVKLIDDAVNGFVGALPGVGSLVGRIDVMTFDFVAQSAPKIVGQGGLMVSSDELSFTQSVSGATAITVVPVSRASESTQAPAMAMSTYVYVSEDRFSRQQNPGAIIVAGEAIKIAEAAQIGLGAAAMVQSGVQAVPSGSFQLTYPRAERLLTNEARQDMPGAKQAKSTHKIELLRVGASSWIGNPGFANALITVAWEGNIYGEIGTVVVDRDLDASSDWSKSDFSMTINFYAGIPDASVDPRGWPLVFTYTGRYDPPGNGMWEFSGEFQINAFGAFHVNKHKVVSRAAIGFLISGAGEDYVRQGKNIDVVVPQIPADQLAYLKKKLP